MRADDREEEDAQQKAREEMNENKIKTAADILAFMGRFPGSVLLPFTEGFLVHNPGENAVVQLQGKGLAIVRETVDPNGSQEVYAVIQV